MRLTSSFLRFYTASQIAKANPCTNEDNAIARKETTDPVSDTSIRVWASGNDVCAQINRENQAGIPFLVTGPEPVPATTSATTTIVNWVTTTDTTTVFDEPPSTPPPSTTAPDTTVFDEPPSTATPSTTVTTTTQDLIASQSQEPRYEAAYLLIAVLAIQN